MGPVNAADLEVVQKLNSPSSVDVPRARVSDLDRNVLIYDINYSNYRDSRWDGAIKVYEDPRKSVH